jgi:hypothetical protein
MARRKMGIRAQALEITAVAICCLARVGFDRGGVARIIEVQDGRLAHL